MKNRRGCRIKALAFAIPVTMILALGWRHYQLMQQDILDDFKALMADRNNVVKDYCNRMKDNPTERLTMSFDHLLYLNQRPKIIWCPVFKAASSSWTSKLVGLTSKGQEVSNLTSNFSFLRSLTEPVTSAKHYSQVKDQALGLIVVRHPFHRLVSAFRDKLERRHSQHLRNDYFFKLYGQSMVARYRQRAIKKFGSDYFSQENNFGAPLPVIGQRSPDQPIFWEFVQFFLDSATWDEHWTPAYQYCSVCMVNYDIILKFESLESEEPRLWQHLGIKDISKPVMNKYSKNESLSEEEITAKYFATLDQIDIDQLYDVWKMDFKMFEYSFEINGQIYS